MISLGPSVLNEIIGRPNFIAFVTTNPKPYTLEGRIKTDDLR